MRLRGSCTTHLKDRGERFISLPILRLFIHNKIIYTTKKYFLRVLIQTENRFIESVSIISDLLNNNTGFK